MTPIRVGLSTSMVEPSLTKGHLDGIGVYTTALLSGLPASGCAVQGYSFPPLMNGSASTAQWIGKKLPHSYGVSTVLDIAAGKSLRARLPVDVFHATDYRIVYMDCPLVATLHDAIPIKYPQWASPRLRKLKNWIYQKAARKADHVISLSAYAVAELVECYGIDEKKITVVPCGVSPQWLTPLPQQEVDLTLEKHGLRRGYFLFVGTLQPRKNVERILDAYLKLPDALKKERQLVIAGRAGWNCDSLVARLQDARQRGENVVWLDYVPGEMALRHLYAGAGAFVFPSLHEGFGIPVLEAFASGVPVVISNATSLPEVALGAAVEVDPFNADQLADAMQALVRDEALRARCIAAGRKRAEQLSWENTVKQTVEVYKTVLAA
jgi:alpha-1,3-rhamnosyl/mannosyltransferase